MFRPKYFGLFASEKEVQFMPMIEISYDRRFSGRSAAPAAELLFVAVVELQVGAFIENGNVFISFSVFHSRHTLGSILVTILNIIYRSICKSPRKVNDGKCCTSSATIQKGGSM